MGRAKQSIFDNEHNQNLIDFLKTLLNRDELKGAIEGITKQINGKGFESLTEHQKNVIENFANYYSTNYECEVCSNGNVSNYSDYIEIADTGLCPMCQYDRERFMKD